MAQVMMYRVYILLWLRVEFVEAVVVYSRASEGLVGVPVGDPAPNVTNVILDYNHITTIPADAFIANPLLDYFSMKSNGLNTVHPAAFAGTVLRVFKVIRNALTEIPDLSVVEDYLNELHVQQNHISDVTNLAGLSSVTKIFMNNNFVTAIRFSSISTLTSLVRLSVRNNIIVTLEDMSSLSNHHLYFEMNDNNLTCDCTLAWTKDSSNSNLNVVLNCARPPHLEGQLLGNINVSQLCPGERLYT